MAASYDAVIKLVVQGEEALKRIQTRIDNLYKTISDLETKKKFAGSEAAVKFVRQQADELERVVATSKQIIKQDEQRVIQQSKLNAAVDLYERRVKQVTNSGAAQLKKFKGQIEEIETAFSFFSKRGNVTAVQALATELGRMVEYANAVNRSERERAANLSALRGFAKELSRYEEQGLNISKARQKFDALAAVADTNKTTEAKKYIEALTRQLKLLKEQSTVNQQIVRDTAALQAALGRLEAKSAAAANAELQARGLVAAQTAKGVAAAKYKAQQPAAQLMLPAYQERGLQILNNSVKLNESQLRIERALNDERARGVRFLEKQSAEEARQVDLGIKAQRTNMLGGVPVGAMPSSAQYAGQFVGPKAAPGTRLAAGLQQAGMPTFAGGIRQAGRTGIPGAGMLGGAIPGAVISGAFPLLTGQGVEAAVGGGIGGLAGGAIGAAFGPGGAAMGSFAGGLVGSIIGERIGEAKKLTEELQRQLQLNQGVEASERALLQLKKDIVAAQMEGNESLAIELERRKTNKEIATELLKASTALLSDERNKTKEGRALVALDEQRLYSAAQRSVQENNALAVLQQQRLAMQEQIAEAKHLAELAKGQVDIEKQRVSMTANYVQARSQAEIAVNNVILERLNSELQSATTAQERLQLATEIYKVEVANAQARYTATVAQIQAQVQLAELAVKEQQIRAIQLETERAILAAKGAQVKEIDRAIQKQQQAIQLASENAGLAKLIAAEQLRGANATLQAAIQAAELRKQINGAAQGAAAYTKNMQAGAAATQAATAATKAITEPKKSGLAFIPALTIAKNFEQALKLYEEKKSYGIAAEMPQMKDFMPGGRRSGFFPTATFGSIKQRDAVAQLRRDRENALQTVMARYREEQSRSSSEYINPQINVTTGPVMQMDGTNYVTQRDFTTGMQTAARQGAGLALSQLERDPATRRRVGVTR